MKSRQLCGTDIVLSEIGLGCQSLGGGLHHGNRREALNLVARALDCGVTYFDTADHYSLGRSEKLLGRALRRKRQQVVIGTKVGTVYTRAARSMLGLRPALRLLRRPLRRFKHDLDRLRSTQRRADFSVAHLERAVEGSLRRLGTDYIDLLHLHKPGIHDLRSGTIAAAIAALRQNGKVRHVGVSSENLNDALAALDIPGVTFIQVTVNLLDQAAVIDFLPAARARGIGVIARNPRAAGLLTDRFGDITAETYALSRDDFEILSEDAKRFGFLADSERTLAQAAIRFVLQLPGIVATTPRALDETELEGLLKASTLPDLTRQELEAISMAYTRLSGRIERYPYRSGVQ